MVTADVPVEVLEVLIEHLVILPQEHHIIGVFLVFMEIECSSLLFTLQV